MTAPWPSAPGSAEWPRGEPWHAPHPPRRILLIRIQALGDTVITLPYARALKEALPGAELDMLTRSDAAGIPRELGLFARVFALGGGWSAKRQCLHLLALLPRLAARRYDVIVDLQNSRVSRIVRRALRVRAWSEFDRYSARAAGVRTLDTIEQAGLKPAPPRFALRMPRSCGGFELLAGAGRRPNTRLMILNPAGALPSRNWPLEHYAALARQWLAHAAHDWQFVILGLPPLGPRAAELERRLGTRLINLVGRTTPEQAFEVVGLSDLVVSEDSGLMHMAWVSGIPTVALLGSSRSDWSRPLGVHTVCLDSSDLACGCCMQPHCRFGDNRCLTRYSGELVAGAARRLLERRERDEPASARPALGGAT